ncbi:MAG: hypothetical protein NVS3B10_21560 [Polyangiales bacterium]
MAARMKRFATSSIDACAPGLTAGGDADGDVLGGAAIAVADEDDDEDDDGDWAVRKPSPHPDESESASTHATAHALAHALIDVTESDDAARGRSMMRRPRA